MASPVPMQIAGLRATSGRTAGWVIGAASLLALLGLVGVIYGHGRAQSEPSWAGYLPALNALLNATSATFLVLGWSAIRRRDVATHARRMLTALAASALFLVSYVVYHAIHGDTRFMGQGPVRPVYFFVLISHVGLSAVALPLVMGSVFLSLSGRFPMHRRLARYTLPLWLYVSVTGVLVFAMLRTFG